MFWKPPRTYDLPLPYPIKLALGWLIFVIIPVGLLLTVLSLIGHLIDMITAG